jgi:hypothetical protein
MIAHSLVIESEPDNASTSGLYQPMTPGNGSLGGVGVAELRSLRTPRRRKVPDLVCKTRRQVLTETKSLPSVSHNHLQSIGVFFLCFPYTIFQVRFGLPNRDPSFSFSDIVKSVGIVQASPLLSFCFLILRCRLFSHITHIYHGFIQPTGCAQDG